MITHFKKNIYPKNKYFYDEAVAIFTESKT